MDCFSEHSRIPAESLLPIPVTDHHMLLARAVIVVRSERPAQQRLDAHHTEESGAGINSIHTFHAIRAGNVEMLAGPRPRYQRSQFRERAALCPPVREIRRRHAALRTRSGGVLF